MAFSGRFFVTLSRFSTGGLFVPGRYDDVVHRLQRTFYIKKQGSFTPPFLYISIFSWWLENHEIPAIRPLSSTVAASPFRAWFFANSPSAVLTHSAIIAVSSVNHISSIMTAPSLRDVRTIREPSSLNSAAPAPIVSEGKCHFRLRIATPDFLHCILSLQMVLGIMSLKLKQESCKKTHP